MEILIQFDEICKSIELNYFLGWGTLIGAVRHKGFIPWDDDLDILMPRNDFNKFKTYIKDKYNGQYKLCSRANTLNYFYGIPRLSDPNYIYVSEIKNEKQFELGAFIDIYPIDSYGNDAITAKHIYNNIVRYNSIYMYSINPSRKGFSWKSIIKYILGQSFRLAKGPHWNEHIDNEILSYIKKHTDPNDPYVGIAVWGDPYGKYLWKREWFGGSIQMEFEGHLFPVPIGYHELLTFIYGDYMQLPPKEKRIPHHDYKLYARD